MTAIKNGTLLVKDSNGNTARVATLSQTDITTLNTALADVGQIAVRVQAIEDKNVEQDTALDNETKARVAKDAELTNALANEQQTREQKDTSLETKNTEQDRRLDALETKNTEQASSGLELLTVLIMPLGVDETENQFRYLNGQVIMQDQFADFTSKLKARMTLFPSLFTTEENWQAEKTNSKLGQCGKFVVDDTAGTIRLPCVVNIQGLTDLASIGEIKSESLPNITGNFGASMTQGNFLNFGTGAFGSYEDTTVSQAVPQVGGVYDSNNRWNFDASRSSSTYQDNAPVQQEAIQYPYVIVVGVKAKEATKPINDYQVNNVYSFGMSQYYKGTMNNNSWLRSNNQWNSGTVYVDFYEWLLEHLNAGDAGFKSSTATDITDYDYVINTTGQTFRLPLLNGKETSIGSNYQSVTVKASGSTYTAPANGWFVAHNNNNQMGSCRLINTTKHICSLSAAVANFSDGMAFVPVTTGDVVELDYIGVFGLATGYFYFIPAQGNGNLYYYIGDTLQNATLINVARIEEKLVDLSSASRGYLVESYRNGVNWYRVYSDGFIEQGGVFEGTGSYAAKTYSFLKPFSNTNYFFIASIVGLTSDWMTNTNNVIRIYTTDIHGTILFASKTKTSIAIQSCSNHNWYACGY